MCVQAKFVQVACMYILYGIAVLAFVQCQGACTLCVGDKTVYAECHASVVLYTVLTVSVLM